MHCWTEAVRIKVFDAAYRRLFDAVASYQDLLAHDTLVASEFLALRQLHNSCISYIEGRRQLADDDQIREFRAHARQFEATSKRRQKLYEKRGLMSKLRAIIDLRDNVYLTYKYLIDNNPGLNAQWINARETLRQCGKPLSFNSLQTARQQICQVRANCKRREALNKSLAANPDLGFQLG